ncbi:glycosyltransferase family 4 protein [Nocardia sp. NPDC060259]|uniref:glycosyltransferase family 4 protein n=1 Tax=Nocardia sp. NPDC060259 TaxID=3347088 RepID=UPI00364628ED
MKILLISTTYRPRLGGLETYITTMAEHLARDHEVTVVTNRDAWDQPMNAMENGVRVLRGGALLHSPVANSVPWEAALFSVLTDITALTNGLDFDVVHTHTQAALLLASMAGLDKRAPLVASFHETEPAAEPGGTERSRFVFRACAPDRVVAGSQAFAAQATSFGYSTEQVRIVYHGVTAPPIHHQASRSDVRSRAHVPEDGVLICLIGRFKPRKGQHRLLDAFLEMRHRDRARLLMVGSCNSADTSYLSELRTRINEHGLHQHVTLLAECSDSVRDAVWAASDIATQPSSVEGLGLACIEAMHAGLPVVATDTAGLNEVLTHDTGLLLDTTDPTKFAAALDTLVEDPVQRLGIGAKARRRARTVFSVERAVTDTVAVYHEVIAARASAREPRS